MTTTVCPDCHEPSRVPVHAREGRCPDTCRPVRQRTRRRRRPPAEPVRLAWAHV
ncbi:hypothetical protein ACI798_20555 [Geodermatophilus sp. SYSU D01045]